MKRNVKDPIIRFANNIVSYKDCNAQRFIMKLSGSSHNTLRFLADLVGVSLIIEHCVWRTEIKRGSVFGEVVNIEKRR